MNWLLLFSFFLSMSDHEVFSLDPGVARCALLPVAMETGPVQVEPLAGILSVTWVSLAEEPWRKCLNSDIRRVDGEAAQPRSVQ